MMVIVFIGVPIILMILFHYFYIKLGIYLSRKFILKKELKISFWVLYLSFGFILIYTDYIWGWHSSVLTNNYTKNKNENIYKDYLKTDTKDYQNCIVHLKIDKPLVVQFSAHLITDNNQCKRSTTILYPLINKREYDIKIFKEYKNNVCEYKLNSLSINLYKSNLLNGKYFDSINLSHHKYKESIQIVCEEKTNTKTQCNILSSKGHLFDIEKSNHLYLDISVNGLISGKSNINKLSKHISLSNAFKKFEIFTISYK